MIYLRVHVWRPDLTKPEGKLQTFYRAIKFKEKHKEANV